MKFRLPKFVPIVLTALLMPILALADEPGYVGGFEALPLAEGLVEITGAGGTQRLPRAIGKAKTMDLILTGRMMDVEEAERAGLVSRVVPLESLLDEALGVAATIAAMSLPSVTMAKEAVNRAYESTLREGVLFERRLFYSTFALEDQKEGMAAFAAKRAPNFNNR